MRGNRRARTRSPPRSRAGSPSFPDSPVSHDQDESVIRVLSVALEHAVGRPLGRIARDDPLFEPRPDAIGRENERIAGRETDDGGPQRGHPEPHHTAPQQESLDSWSRPRVRPQEHARDVPHTQPRHRAVGEAERGDANRGPARRREASITPAKQVNDGLAGVLLERRNSDFRGSRRFLSVPQPVDHRGQPALWERPDHVTVPRRALPGERSRGHAPFDDSGDQRFHFLAVTVVPFPGRESISISSMSRRTPGRPSPRLPDVENPSRIARSTSSMPGPASRATTTIPSGLWSFAGETAISPLVA